jgi:hypothetical protein
LEIDGFSFSGFQLNRRPVKAEFGTYTLKHNLYSACDLI